MLPFLFLKAQQSRSRLTYQAILGATAQILKYQPDSLDTNKIARISGVSIGSLYQYYPIKEAILAELIEREFELKQTLNKRLKELGKIQQTSNLQMDIIEQLRNLFLSFAE